jgi:aspartate carbamoyltransferase catalytic subunit
MKHILRAQDFDIQLLDNLFDSAKSLKTSSQPQTMRGKVMCSLFYEPSTRTRLSFESAHLKLGGSVIGTENASEFSSSVKGETLEDSIRVISNYANVIVLRHGDNHAAERAAQVSSCPIINAGSGTGQHPTQSLTDIYTIRERFGMIGGMSVAIAGDLKHGRTARSLAYMLSKYPAMKIYFIAPDELQMGQDIIDYLVNKQVHIGRFNNFDPILSEVDVIYQTRLQNERHGIEQHRYNIDITAETVSKMKTGSIVMHPLPRNGEIHPEVDSLPNAAYFEQAANSLWVRMALLNHLFS